MVKMFLDSRKRKNSNTSLEERKWLINGWLQKVTGELDQMFIEDDADGNEDVEYFDLVEVPDAEIVTENNLENVSENTTKKNKVQSKITSFFNAKK